jgi:hypothetical protein
LIASGDTHRIKKWCAIHSTTTIVNVFTADQNTFGKAINNSNAPQNSDRRKEKQTPNEDAKPRRRKGQKAQKPEALETFSHYRHTDTTEINTHT